MSESATLTTEQFLTFILNKEIFAIDIAKVREVLEFATVTRIPRTPGFMRGVINLRGNVVPVIDLKNKFGMGFEAETAWGQGLGLIGMEERVKELGGRMSITSRLYLGTRVLVELPAEKEEGA